jgi:hypothetical protein
MSALGRVTNLYRPFTGCDVIPPIDQKQTIVEILGDALVLSQCEAFSTFGLMDSDALGARRLSTDWFSLISSSENRAHQRLRSLNYCFS